MHVALFTMSLLQIKEVRETIIEARQQLYTNENYTQKVYKTEESKSRSDSRLDVSKSNRQVWLGTSPAMCQVKWSRAHDILDRHALNIGLIIAVDLCTVTCETPSQFRYKVLEIIPFS